MIETKDWPRVAAVLLSIFVPATQAGSAQQRPIFRAEVDRVRVDVIVNDADGRFVDDLRAEDFLLFEDGEPQEVLSVQLVDLARGAVVNLSGGGTGAEAAAGDLPVAQPTPSVGVPESVAADFGAMVFLVDFPGLFWRSKYVFASAWEDLLAETDSLGIPRAVYIIDQLQRFRELTPLTMDPVRLREAAREVGTTPLARRSVRERILAGEPASEFAFRERERSLYTLELLAQLSSGMSVRNGRTALVWVSSGLSLEVLDADLGVGTPLDPDLFIPDRQIIERLAEFQKAANSANVSVYAIDPSSRTDLNVGVADAALATLPSVEARRRLNETLAEQSDPLVVVARATGGQAFVGWADLSQVLGRIEEDTSHYYLLTYEPPAPYNDGEYHQLSVEVRRPGVDVRARGGYVDYSEEDRNSRLINAAISTPGMATEIGLTAEAFRTWSDGESTVMLAVAVDATDLGFSIDAQGVAVTSLEIHAAALDDRGRVLAELSDVMRAPIALDPTGDAQPGPVIRRYGWTIDPGEYDVRVMVLDETTGRVGATRLDLIVPEAPGGDWFTSDPMLVHMLADLSFVPVVGGRIAEGTPVNAQIEVYGGQQPVMSGRIELVATASGNTETQDAAQTQIPPRRLLRAGEGTHRGTLPLPRLPAGDYVLHLRITEPGTDHEQSFDVRLQVVPVGDDLRFLLAFPADASNDEPYRIGPQVNVVLNWFEELKERVPTGGSQ